MHGIAGPFDEERQQSATVVLQAKRLPVKDFSIWPRARPVRRTINREARARHFLRYGGDIVGVYCPRQQARLAHFAQLGISGEGSLLRVGRDDFQIASRAQPEKRVLSAAPWMHPAKCGADSRAFLHKGDASVEIVDAQQDVIEHGGKVLGRTQDWERHERGRRDNGVVIACLWSGLVSISVSRWTSIRFRRAGR